MTLADELRGIAIRCPMVGTKRRHYLLDEQDEVRCREEKLQKKRAYQRAWSKANPEKVKAMRQRYSAKHSGKKAKSSRAWKLRNVEYVRAYSARAMRQWRRKYPERARATKKRWYEKNRETILARRRARYGAQKRLMRTMPRKGS